MARTEQNRKLQYRKFSLVNKGNKTKIHRLLLKDIYKRYNQLGPSGHHDRIDWSRESLDV